MSEKKRPPETGVMPAQEEDDGKIPPDFWVGLVLGMLAPVSLWLAWWAAQVIYEWLQRLPI